MNLSNKSKGLIFSIYIVFSGISHFAFANPKNPAKSAQSENEPTLAVVTPYEGSCLYAGPLMATQNCDENSEAGISAKSCALQKAAKKCTDDNNTDCIEISTTYDDVRIKELIAYKACEAKITLRGYKIMN